MVSKLEYLVRTLSRTTRKDYENYVINAFWNRLADLTVKPVSQKLVVKDSAHRYFIDLYFPQVNLGVECNEIYHGQRVKEDANRALDIFDILSTVDTTGDYKALNVDLYERFDDNHIEWKPVKDVETQINDGVSRVRERVEQLRASKAYVPWTGEEKIQDLLRNENNISVSEEFGFRTIKDVCNNVFNENYQGMQRSYFEPRHLKAKYGHEYVVWFPKRAIAGHAVARNWRNILSDDGLSLSQYNERNPRQDDTDRGIDLRKRIVFIQVMDPVTRVREYRFAGVFQYDGLDHVDNGFAERYIRIADRFPILK